MRYLNVNWSALPSRAIHSRTRFKHHYAEHREEQALLLTGPIGIAIWAVIIIAIWLATSSALLAGFVGFCVSRRLRMSTPTPVRLPVVVPAMWAAPVPTARPTLPAAPVAVVGETSVTGVQISVYQSTEGPTVSVLTFPHGEIYTRVCVSWPAAGAYAGKTRAKYVALGVPVEYVQERI